MPFILYYDPTLNRVAQWYAVNGTPIDRLASILGIIALSLTQFKNVVMSPNSPPAPDWNEGGDTTIVPLVPTTWNPSDKTPSMALSGGNLIATGGAGGNGVRGVAGLGSGKYYWEVTATTWSGGSECGVNTAGATLGASSAATIVAVNGSGSLLVNGGISLAFGARANGDIVCFAFDFSNQRVWARIGAAGNWNNSGTANPATGTGGISYSAAPIGALLLYPYAFTSLAGHSFTANFGASAFVGAVPAGFVSGFP